MHFGPLRFCKMKFGDLGFGEMGLNHVLLPNELTVWWSRSFSVWWRVGHRSRCRFTSRQGVSCCHRCVNWCWRPQLVGRRTRGSRFFTMQHSHKIWISVL